MKIENIFTSFIATDFLTDIDNDELKEYAFKLQENNEGVIKSNFLGWQSDILTDLSDQVTDLASNILQRMNTAKKPLGFRDDTMMYLANMWININPTNSFNRPHLHPGAIFSGVYYIDCTPDSGNLVFKHPSIGQLYSLQEDTLSDFTDFNAGTWSVHPEVGKLVIFPAWLEHYVEPNASTESRISIAFNINIKKVTE
jgi:uncharacterized protein (TIGR02466 family)